MSLEIKQKIPANAIICTVEEIGEGKEKRLYVRMPLYGDKSIQIGSPDKRVLDLYKENEYAYNELPQDRKWQKFLGAVKRRKVWALIKQINRTRAVSDGRISDIYTVYVGIHGTNNKQMHEQDSRMIGVWREPQFTKELDPQDEILKTIGVDQSTRIFEFTLDVKDEESIKAVEYLVQHCDAEIQFNVSPSPDAKSQTIYDGMGLARASFSELMEMVSRNLTLDEVRESRAYFAQVVSQKTGAKK